MEETAERLERTMITNSLTLKGNAEIDKLILAMESLRKDSLYVGVKSEGGEIGTPKTKISTQMSKDVLLKVEQFIPILETHLKLSRSDYQKVLSKIRDEKRASTESSQSPNQQLP